MSKLFDRTRNVASGSKAEPIGLRMEELLATVKEVVPEGTELAEARQRVLRKVAISGASELLILSHQTEMFAESYRALRTRLARMQANNGLRSIVVSSAIQGEGKTLTVLNLALCYAQLQNAATLIIDGDLRTRGLTRLLGYPGAPGLAEALAGTVPFDSVLLRTDAPNLFAVAAGSKTGSSPELFANPRWKDFIGWCGESFKLVLVDAPPVLPLSDVELLVAGCDGALMVVRALKTSRELLQDAAARLDSGKLLGVVMNAVETVSGHPHYYRYDSSAK